MSCDGARQERKAKMELQDGTPGNILDKKRKGPRGVDVGYTEPRVAHKSTIWINI